MHYIKKGNATTTVAGCKRVGIGEPMHSNSSI